MDKLTELEQEYGTEDLSHIEAGDVVEIEYSEFIHEEGNVFKDIEERTQTLSFRVDKVTHPTGTSVDTIVWDGTSPNSHPSAVSIDSEHKVDKGPEIIGFWYNLTVK